METRANYVLVGAFVVICVLGFFVALLWVAGSQSRNEYSYYRTFFIGPVTGLGKGAPVRYNGIDVGSVSDLAFDEANPKQVVVTLQIDPSLRLHVDSAASTESQGLTGATFVEIEGGTATAPLLKAEPGQQYPVIPSKQSTLQLLARTGPEMVQSLRDAGQKMGELLGEPNQKAIGDTLEHLRQVTSLIDSHAKDLDQTLVNMKTATDSLNRTLTNADRAVVSADRAINTADKALGTIDKAASSVQATSDAANAAVQKVGQLSDDADRAVKGQPVAQFTQLMAESRALVASITRLSNALEREPTRLLFGDQRQGYTPR
jgi:phospholipid/cholesterol/gamma-HCH transport system substrate-binding protein